MSLLAVLDPFVGVADLVVVSVARLLPWPGGGVSVLVGVAVVTVVVRAALLPLSLRAARVQRARARLAPELRELRRRWAGDRARLAAETANLYRRAEVSQVAGIGPALVQLPVLATLYRVVVAPTVGGHPNVVLSASVLGGPLSAHWLTLLSAVGLVSPAGAALAAVVVVLATLGWLSGRQSAARAEAGGASTAMSARVARLLPFTTIAVALLSPLGVGFYLVVSTGWTVAERALLPRWV